MNAVNNAEGRAFAAREMHLAVYGMLLVLTGQQPDVHLPWFEQMMVEDGADEIDAALA